MTIEITQDIVAIAEEFSMSKYSSKLERDAALLLEIVNLRRKLKPSITRQHYKHPLYGDEEFVDGICAAFKNNY